MKNINDNNNFLASADQKILQKTSWLFHKSLIILQITELMSKSLEARRHLRIDGF